MTIETKYNIGDEVWFMHKGEVAADIVKEIEINPIKYNGLYIIHYRLNLKRRGENKDDFHAVLASESALFPTKADLLNSL